MMEQMETERLAAERILERGVRMKLRAPLLFRLVGKKTLSLRVTSPYEGTLLRVASYYLGTGITQEQLEQTTPEQALGLMLAHGKAIRRAVACAWLNGYWAGKLFTRPLAAYLKWHAKPAELLTVLLMVLVYGGVQDFINTTRSVRLMKITAPRLGQVKTKGS